MSFNPDDKVVFVEDVKDGDRLLARKGDKGVFGAYSGDDIVVKLYPLENDVIVVVAPDAVQLDQ